MGRFSRRISSSAVLDGPSGPAGVFQSAVVSAPFDMSSPGSSHPISTAALPVDASRSRVCPTSFGVELQGVLCPLSFWRHSLALHTLMFFAIVPDNSPVRGLDGSGFSNRYDVKLSCLRLGIDLYSDASTLYNKVRHRLVDTFNASSSPGMVRFDLHCEFDGCQRSLMSAAVL